MTGLGTIGAGEGLQASGKGLATGLGAPYNIGVGNSFTMNGWMSAAVTLNSVYFGINGAVNYSFAVIDPNAGAGPASIYANDNGTQTFIPGGVTLVNGSWHMYTIGYDASTKLFFFAIDAGTRSTVALTTGIAAQNTPVSFGNYSSFAASQSNPSAWQDWGFWSRALSPNDVNTLYATGAGFPFSSFTN